ncbi:hypothetical protein RRG08_006301 [Elysia crispata]|uniref:CS domain-containing protein n=1 Tax=Elysia crispata TaxID=231223 RepID=A0AAE0YPR1_9GAST|nr:hypothetical protein RRG08_006301 [Elysia crispata]
MSDSSKYRDLKRVLGEVWAKGVNKEIVTIEIPCDKLIPTENKCLPKNGTCDVKFLPDCRSFEVKLTLKDDKEKTKTRWSFNLRQLPGRIVREKSTWTIVKGMIVVKLHKEEENDDWTLAVRAKGIDQLNSDESS